MNDAKPKRATMNGKPVIEIEAGSIINYKSERLTKSEAAE